MWRPDVAYRQADGERDLPNSVHFRSGRDRGAAGVWYGAEGSDAGGEPRLERLDGGAGHLREGVVVSGLMDPSYESVVDPATGRTRSDIDSCDIVVDAPAGATLAGLREVLEHETAHCAFDELLAPGARLALVRNIAEAVPLDTLRTEWFGADLSQRVAPGGDADSDRAARGLSWLYERRLTDHARDGGYPMGTPSALGDRLQAGVHDSLRVDPASGRVHLVPEALADAPGRPGERGALALYVEEAAVFLATSGGGDTRAVPVGTPEHLAERAALGRMGPAEMKARVNNLVHDMGEVYGERLSLERFQDRHAGVLTRFGAPLPAPSLEAGRPLADAPHAGAGLQRPLAGRDGAGSTVPPDGAGDLFRTVRELEELTLVGPASPPGTSAVSGAASPPAPGAAPGSAAERLQALRAERADVAERLGALGAASALSDSAPAGRGHALLRPPAEPAPERAVVSSASRDAGMER